MVSTGIESPLISENNPDTLTMQLFLGGPVFNQQPFSLSGFNKYRFFKFLFNNPVEFSSFQLPSFVTVVSVHAWLYKTQAML